MADGNSEKLHLSELITPELVSVGAAAGSWQEAVQLSGQLLLKSGRIEARYIDAMERSVRELGPYAVLAPGIVLLHARPDDGVIIPCLSLVILSTPVNFGHSQNDPVDLVFALGAVDKNAHIQALQQLATLLANPDFLAAVRAAKTRQELFAVIQTWSEKLS